MRNRVKIQGFMWKSVIIAILLTLLVTAFQPLSPVQAEPNPPIPIFHRTIRLPANALNYDSTDTSVITKDATGLRWKPDYSKSATIGIPKPVDFSAATDVTLSLFFTTTDASLVLNPTVEFFIRPRSFDVGDQYLDASPLNSSAITVAGSQKFYKQEFTIPATKLDKAFWVITIQRVGTTETYVHDVILKSIEINYGRTFVALSSSQGFPAKALNFDNNSTIISQYALGLRWNRNYANSANLAIPRPKDWDGLSDINLDLFFFPFSAGSGNTGFFIRPRGYSAGDLFGDASDLSGLQPVMGQFFMLKQSFSIPASRFTDKELLYISIQRNGIPQQDTYTGDLVVTGFSITYARKSSTITSYGVPANSLAFVEGSVISQNALGLTWTNNYLNPAYIIIPHNYGWTGGGMFLKLYFKSSTGTGDVQFFVGPRAFNIGDQWADSAGIQDTPAHVTSNNSIFTQTFFISPDKFGLKDLWVITLQRGGAQETYAGTVDLMAVELATASELYLPITQK